MLTRVVIWLLVAFAAVAGALFFATGLQEARSAPQQPAMAAMVAAGMVTVYVFARAITELAAIFEGQRAKGEADLGARWAALQAKEQGN